jgi:hypothetical protein
MGAAYEAVLGFFPGDGIASGEDAEGAEGVEVSDDGAYAGAFSFDAATDGLVEAGLQGCEAVDGAFYLIGGGEKDEGPGGGFGAAPAVFHGFLYGGFETDAEVVQPLAALEDEFVGAFEDGAGAQEGQAVPDGS